MSYDIGNLGLKGSEKKRTWLYVGVAVVIVVVVVAALFLTGVI